MSYCVFWHISSVSTDPTFLNMVSLLPLLSLLFFPPPWAWPLSMPLLSSSSTQSFHCSFFFLVFLSVDLIWFSLRAGQITYLFTELQLIEFSGETTVQVLYLFIGSVNPTPGLLSKIEHGQCPAQNRAEWYSLSQLQVETTDSFFSLWESSQYHSLGSSCRTPGYNATLHLGQSIHKCLLETFICQTLWEALNMNSGEIN